MQSNEGLPFLTRNRFKDDEFEVQKATNLSLSTDHEKQMLEEEDTLVAMAYSDNTFDEELQITLAISQAVKEEEDLKKAMDVSAQMAIASYEDELSLELAKTLSLSNRQQSTFNQRRPEQPTVQLPLIPLQEQLSEWLLDDSPDQEEVQFPSYHQTQDELPKMYRDYRLVPTMFSESVMWPLEAVLQQQTELRLAKGIEEVREWQEGDSFNHRCLVCLTNVATRVAVPCGHKLCCRTCSTQLINKPSYYSVTETGGQVLTTDWRLPLQCFTCKAIIGQIVPVY